MQGQKLRTMSKAAPAYSKASEDTECLAGIFQAQREIIIESFIWLEQLLFVSCLSSAG